MPSLLADCWDAREQILADDPGVDHPADHLADPRRSRLLLSDGRYGTVVTTSRPYSTE